MLAALYKALELAARLAMSPSMFWNASQSELVHVSCVYSCCRDCTTSCHTSLGRAASGCDTLLGNRLSAAVLRLCSGSLGLRSLLACEALPGCLMGQEGPDQAHGGSSIRLQLH